jgi:2'-hydroxyisoflavone reductase
MRLLILGGTKFLGRAVVDAALDAGHEVTMFNRGETNPELFPDVEKLRGNRDGDLVALEGRQWDVAVDPSGYVPRVVRASAELLRDAVEHYTFVSSVSVYGTFREPGFDESAATEELTDPDTEEVMEHYGALKAACERVVHEIFPERALHVRAGLIVGPHDPTDRFTYWPVRVARGGEVLAPGRPERQVQFVDVRDLADWIVRCAEDRVAGTFNATGPVPPVTMGELLETCRAVSGSDATFTWVDDAFLLANEVGPWMELPLWVPESDPEIASIMAADVSRAVAAGLTFRPVAQTVADTLAWAGNERPFEQTGLDAAKEERLLEGARQSR